MDRRGHRRSCDPDAPEGCLSMTSPEHPAPTPETATVAGRSAFLDDLRLPKPPGVFRTFFARHAWVVDSAIVVLFGLPAILTLFAFRPGSRPEAVSVPVFVLSIIGTALVLVTLYLRRRYPLVLVGAVAAGALLAQGVNGVDNIPPFVALYGAAVYVSVRAAWLAFALLSVVRIGSDLLWQGGDIAGTLGTTSVSIFLMLIATLVGINVGNRKRYVEALLDRAAQLARERDQQAQLSAASERARIAREMHDIIAHSLTVMVALADGADRMVGVDPDRAQDAIRRVAETGRGALADMRIVLGILAKPLEVDSPSVGGGPIDPRGEGALALPPVRETLDAPGGGAFQPQPGHEDLDTLVASYRSAGMVVVYTVTGAITPDPGIQLAVFRIVQEALTNSLRYAPDPKHVTVTVVYEAPAITVTVADQGQSQLAAPSIGTGSGIMGMRERVRGYGGSVEAGPTTAGGWRVRAVIPQKEPSPAAQVSSESQSQSEGEQS
ncbi:two-component sensor histidine kinase [Subtercola sp. Z020]|nr:two-component sensor histidine kinase [Subtercola sp. Z020]